VEPASLSNKEGEQFEGLRMTKIMRLPSFGEKTTIRWYLKQYAYSAAVLYNLMQDGTLIS
jgi:hypothetical protein